MRCLPGARFVRGKAYGTDLALIPNGLIVSSSESQQQQRLSDAPGNASASQTDAPPSTTPDGGAAAAGRWLDAEAGAAVLGCFTDDALSTSSCDGSEGTGISTEDSVSVSDKVALLESFYSVDDATPFSGNGGVHHLRLEKFGGDAHQSNHHFSTERFSSSPPAEDPPGSSVQPPESSKGSPEALTSRAAAEGGLFARNPSALLSPNGPPAFSSSLDVSKYGGRRGTRTKPDIPSSTQSPSLSSQSASNNGTTSSNVAAQQFLGDRQSSDAVMNSTQRRPKSWGRVQSKGSTDAQFHRPLLAPCDETESEESSSEDATSPFSSDSDDLKSCSSEGNSKQLNEKSYPSMEASRLAGDKSDMNEHKRSLTLHSFKEAQALRRSYSCPRPEQGKNMGGGSSKRRNSDTEPRSQRNSTSALLLPSFGSRNSQRQLQSLQVPQKIGSAFHQLQRRASSWRFPKQVCKVLASGGSSSASDPAGSLSPSSNTGCTHILLRRVRTNRGSPPPPARNLIKGPPRAASVLASTHVNGETFKRPSSAVPTDDNLILDSESSAEEVSLPHSSVRSESFAARNDSDNRSCNPEAAVSVSAPLSAPAATAGEGDVHLLHPKEKEMDDTLCSEVSETPTSHSHYPLHLNSQKGFTPPPPNCIWVGSTAIPAIPVSVTPAVSVAHRQNVAPQPSEEAEGCTTRRQASDAPLSSPQRPLTEEVAAVSTPVDCHRLSLMTTYGTIAPMGRLWRTPISPSVASSQEQLLANERVAGSPSGNQPQIMTSSTSSTTSGCSIQASPGCAQAVTGMARDVPINGPLAGIRGTGVVPSNSDSPGCPAEDSFGNNHNNNDTVLATGTAAQPGCTEVIVPSAQERLQSTRSSLVTSSLGKFQLAAKLFQRSWTPLQHGANQCGQDPAPGSASDSRFSSFRKDSIVGIGGQPGDIREEGSPNPAPHGVSCFGPRRDTQAPIPSKLQSPSVFPGGSSLSRSAEGESVDAPAFNSAATDSSLNLESSVKQQTHLHSGPRPPRLPVSCLSSVGNSSGRPRKGPVLFSLMPGLRSDESPPSKNPLPPSATPLKSAVAGGNPALGGRAVVFTTAASLGAFQAGPSPVELDRSQAQAHHERSRTLSALEQSQCQQRYHAQRLQLRKVPPGSILKKRTVGVDGRVVNPGPKVMKRVTFTLSTESP